MLRVDSRSGCRNSGLENCLVSVTIKKMRRPRRRRCGRHRTVSLASRARSGKNGKDNGTARTGRRVHARDQHIQRSVDGRRCVSQLQFLPRPGDPACLRRHKDLVRGRFEAAAKFDWDVVHPLATSANPSGRVTDACFETMSSRILDMCDGVDGILLHLHGSMSTQSHDDGEGELLLRIRNRVGADVPVVAVLDLHATVTQAMADNANALISYRTYPHIDQYERTWQAAELLEKAMSREIMPRVALARRPILYALDGGRTTSPPFMELLRRGDRIESAKGKHSSSASRRGSPRRTSTTSVPPSR